MARHPSLLAKAPPWVKGAYQNRYTTSYRQYRTMRALVVDGREARLVHDRPIPKLRDDYVLIKPVSVALNPTDWKHIAFGRATDGALIGCDYAGVVEEVGRSVTKQWKKGDRIFGCVHGSNLVQSEDGAFAEYIVAKGDVQMRIPENLSFREAATVPLSSITVGQGLYHKSLKLRLPSDGGAVGEYVLIYGGGTAAGSLAIQYAKLSGYTVITVCAPEHFDAVRERGAEYCFDYTKQGVGHAIRELTENNLRYAWDTIAIDATAKCCADALSTYPNSFYGGTNQVEVPRKDVTSSTVVMYTMFGEAFTFGPTKFEALSEDFEFAKKFTSLTEQLLAQGKLHNHPVLYRQGGLSGIPEGLKELQGASSRFGKLVYDLAE